MSLNTEQSERIGVSYCEGVFSRLGFIFREQPIRDYGIDAQIETFNEKAVYPSGKIVAVQIKSGVSYFSEISDEYVVFRGDIKHYNYWLKHALPVIIILFNPDTEECIWEHVNFQTAKKTSKAWQIKVPRNKNLIECKRPIEAISENQSEYEKKLHTMLLAKPWMQAIKEGDNVILEASEWVNKTSGRGAVTLKIEKSDSSGEKVIDWPFVCFGLKNYADVFTQLFPWADFDVDHELYDDIEIEECIADSCPYDSETGEYLFTDCPEFMEDFEEYRNGLSEIRPHSIDSGEVASYRLLLSLNHIGEIFLELDQFLEEEKMYCIEEDDIE